MVLLDPAEVDKNLIENADEETLKGKDDAEREINTKKEKKRSNGLDDLTKAFTSKQRK